MKTVLWRSLATVPYLLVIVAAAVSFYFFSRSDELRRGTGDILSQTYELQWRASQARERIATISGYLQLLVKVHEPQEFLSFEVNMLDFNVRQILNLNYASEFLDERNIDRLQTSAHIIETKMVPSINLGRYEDALADLSSVKQNILYVSGATINHSEALTANSKLEADVAKSKFGYVTAIAVLLLCGLFLHQRNSLARRKDQHIKSFAALFAHMTRTRFAALRLFIGMVGNNRTPPAEMTEEAKKTIAELGAINEGLMTMGLSASSAQYDLLGKIFENLEVSAPIELEIDADHSARCAQVPVSQFHLLMDELLRNASNAVLQKPEPLITIRATVKRRLVRRPLLILIVKDNGIGMNPATLAKAREPFFSTKAGVHLGLGLTSCMEMVKSMAGKFKITSVPGLGTVVQVSYALPYRH